jgi:hypothetical protein
MYKSQDIIYSKIWWLIDCLIVSINQATKIDVSLKISLF